MVSFSQSQPGAWGTGLPESKTLADEGASAGWHFRWSYDAKTMPHPHFCCDQCGAVYDLHLPYDAELDRQALLASGHDVTGHEVVFSRNLHKVQTTSLIFS